MLLGRKLSPAIVAEETLLGVLSTAADVADRLKKTRQRKWCLAGSAIGNGASSSQLIQSTRYGSVRKDVISRERGQCHMKQGTAESVDPLRDWGSFPDTITY